MSETFTLNVNAVDRELEIDPNLRRKLRSLMRSLNSQMEYVVTVYGVGYKFAEQSE